MKFKVNYKKIIIAAILSFLVSLIISADRSIIIDNRYNFILSFNGNNIMVVCIFVLLIFFYYRLLNYKFNRRTKYAAIICGTIFSLCETVGYNINKSATVLGTSINFYAILFNLLIFVGYFLTFSALILVLFNYIENNESCSGFSKEYKYFTDNWKSFFVVSAILVLCWSLYYVVFFPGIVTWDSYYQIEQGLGLRQLTDENPFLHTLIQGQMIKLGRLLFGSTNLGISVASFIQMISMALIFSFVIKYLAYKKIPYKIRAIILAFYALHPIIGAYSVTLWKDVWMGSFVLLYVIVLIEMCTNSKNFFKNKSNCILLTLVIIAILFLKGTGIIIIILSFPSLFFCCRKYWKKLLLISGLCFLVFFSTRTFIIPNLGIVKGHIREPFSVPLQQIARTVKEHNEDLSDYEKNTINEILPYDDLAKLYVPTLSDNVKGTLDEEAFSSNKVKYAKLWLNLGIKYPRSYLQSFLSNSYGYWYPETVYWEISDSSYYKMLHFYQKNNWTVHDTLINSYSDMGVSSLKHLITNFVNESVRNIPILTLFFSIGFFFWSTFVCLNIAILKKNYSMIPAFLALAAVFIICICSPVHCEMRYAFAVILTIPILAVFSCFKAKKEY